MDIAKAFLAKGKLWFEWCKPVSETVMGLQKQRMHLVTAAPC